VTRGSELLVFEHRDVPPAGLQVPAGRLDPGEALEQGLARELDEETGVRARVVRDLGCIDHPLFEGVLYESHYVHCETEEPRDAWEHLVHGSGDDAGLVFSCRFVPLDPAPLLAGRQGEFLRELR
jgi:ADP-ribose pyrophosphatase YjhB (NUDIX family)